MSATQLFELISSLSGFVSVVVVLTVMHLAPFPRQPGIRAIVSIVAAWAAFILFTALVYNPAGVAAGVEQGAHFPAGKFENNTIASAILGGWLLPTAVMGIYFLGRRSLRAQQGAQDRRAEDSARLS